MQTYTINNLAEQLERDRGTVVKALRNVQPDATVKGRRQWKIATASRAVEAHLRAADPASNNGSIDPKLAALYARFDQGYDAMRALKTVPARRAASIALAPLIAETDAALRTHGRAAGVDPELVDLRADKYFLICMRGFEAPCDWDQRECWEQMDARD
jgi:hypothetical protein